MISYRRLSGQGGPNKKPHIFYFNFKILNKAMWVCQGMGHTGYGKSPLDAYTYWSWFYEDSI